VEEKRDYIEEGHLISEITGSWEAVTKNAEGVAEIHTLHKHSVKKRPLDEEPDLAGLLISQAAPTVIRPSRRKRPTRPDRLTMAFGDAQIPFHDERAIDLAQLAISETQPDNIVFVGDMIDLPSLSRFDQRAEWQGKTQDAIDTYHNVLAQTRANAPNARITVVHGNHEQRLDNYVRRNAMEVLGLRRANMPAELGVLTLQHLVRYDDLEIEAVDGYPNGTLWLEDNLKFVHGTNTQKGGSNAAKYLKEERETTIYGHSHRMEVAYRTWPTRLGHLTVAAASPGALCHIDGSVPGFNHTVNARGQVVAKAEDWQQGLLLINHSGSNHDITPVRISDQGILLGGKRFTAEIA
jgi:predicted phosphodiesterase